MTLSENESVSLLPTRKYPALNFYVLLALVAIIACTGMYLVKSFSRVEEEREMQAWQSKLNIIADSRTADVEAWVSSQFKELSTVASNPSLQIYLTQILGNAPAQADGKKEEPAQTVFLRDLLLITADRMGFVERSSKELQSINAEVQQPSGVGLVLADKDGNFLVSTGGLVPGDEALARKIAEAPKGKVSLIDMFMTEKGQIRIGFVVPVYGIQADETPDNQKGMLIGIKNVDSSLFDLLQQPGVSAAGLSTALLRREGDSVVYLSSVDKAKPLATRFALSTPDLDAAYALQEPGSFAVKKGTSSQATLMTSRSVPSAPWVFMVHVDRSDALAESDRHRRSVEYAMLFALMAVVAGVIAVWYYSTSKRTLQLSHATAALAMSLAAREKLLRVVTDTQIEPILIVDHQNVACFANQQALQTLRLASEDITGKSLKTLLGEGRSAEYIDANQRALETRQPIVRTWQEGEGDGKKVFQTEHIPLSHIPMDRYSFPTPGVLIIDQDVSAVVQEREKRLRVLREVIGALVFMVDKRDPYAAHHSAGVALVASEMARALKLSPVLIDTSEIAGKLMNIGKILVPGEVLTKETSLEEDEIKLVRQSLQNSIGILQSIEFEGPVVDSLRQMQERYDGTGPLGLKGDNILVTARIIAVANAFVGMLSSRSYHKGRDMNEALQILDSASDTQFDGQIVKQLAAFVENEDNKKKVLEVLANAA